ncbi:MAG: hypothetical protein ACI4MB_06655 [Candidatus Coproplasma sp.]
MKITLNLYESKEEECKIKQEQFNSTALIDLLDYSCIMIIKIYDMVYFEEGICPLEMKHAIYNWEQNYNGITYNDFIYNTEDDSLNPIIEFKLDGTKFHINSIHKKFDCNTLFDISDIKSFFDCFKNELARFII